MNEFLAEVHLVKKASFVAIDKTMSAVCRNHFSVNWDETHASPHFKLVSTNFNALVHCSSELNWILNQNTKQTKHVWFITNGLIFKTDVFHGKVYSLYRECSARSTWIVDFAFFHPTQNARERNLQKRNLKAYGTVCVTLRTNSWPINHF